MRFPLVSRERFDDVRQQLADSEAERKELMEIILLRPEPVPKQVEPEVERGNFATPFDRIGSRFDRATDKAKFKARMR